MSKWRLLLKKIKSSLRRLISLLRRKRITGNTQSMPTFEFRLRFNMLKGNHIKSENEEIELLRTEQGHTIRLRAGSRGTPINKSSEIAILGGPYTSQDEARSAADSARAAVVVWAVKQRIGVDFGDGKLRALMTDAGKKHYERELGRPLRNDRLGIDVYESQEGLLFASVSIDAALGKNPESFIEQFRQGMTTPIPLSDKQRLAAELYGLSFFDMSFRSRFITLVTAVEALLDAPIRSQEIQSFINDAKTRADSLATDDATKQSMTSSLERIKYNSIGQTGRETAERLVAGREYDGLLAGKFFTHCYKLRSEIVHTGKPSDPTIDLLQVSNACQAFVADLLLASFGLPSP